jgi:hypothetical protein
MSEKRTCCFLARFVGRSLTRTAQSIESLVMA